MKCKQRNPTNITTSMVSSDIFLNPSGCTRLNRVGWSPWLCFCCLVCWSSSPLHWGLPLDSAWTAHIAVHFCSADFSVSISVVPSFPFLYLLYPSTHTVNLPPCQFCRESRLSFFWAAKKGMRSLFASLLSVFYWWSARSVGFPNQSS